MPCVQSNKSKYTHNKHTKNLFEYAVHKGNIGASHRFETALGSLISSDTTKLPVSIKWLLIILSYINCFNSIRGLVSRTHCIELVRSMDLKHRVNNHASDSVQRHISTLSQMLPTC